MALVAGIVLLDDEPPAVLLEELDGGPGSLAADGAFRVDRRLVQNELVGAECASEAISVPADTIIQPKLN